MIPSLLATEIRSSIADFLSTEFCPATTGFEGLIPNLVFKSGYNPPASCLLPPA